MRIKITIPVVMEYELKNCPFCNSNSLEIKENISDYKEKYNGYWVHCCNCHAIGPLKLKCDEAVNLWNSPKRNNESSIDYVTKTKELGIDLPTEEEVNIALRTAYGSKEKSVESTDQFNINSNEISSSDSSNE